MPKGLYFHPLFFGMQMWHLPISLSYIYSSVFTNLRHICNPSSVNGNFFSDLDGLEKNEIHSFQTPAHRKSAFLGDAFNLTDSNMKSVISFC